MRNFRALVLRAPGALSSAYCQEAKNPFSMMPKVQYAEFKEALPCNRRNRRKIRASYSQRDLNIVKIWGFWLLERGKVTSFLLSHSLSLCARTCTHKVLIPANHQSAHIHTQFLNNILHFFTKSSTAARVLTFFWPFWLWLSSDSPATLPVSIGPREQVSITMLQSAASGGFFHKTLFFRVASNSSPPSLLCSPSSMHHSRVNHSQNIGH